MRLLLISENLWNDFSGTSVYVRNMIRALAERCREVLVIMPDNPPGNHQGKNIRFHVLKGVPFKMGNRFESHKFLKRLEKELPGIIEDFRPNIVHVLYGHHVPRLFGKISDKIPKMWTVHNEPVKEFVIDRTASDLLKSELRKFIRFVGKRINDKRFLKFKYDKIICVSKQTRDFLKQIGVNDSKLTVVPNGVDCSIFYPSEDRVHGSFPFMESYPKLLSVASVIPRKGQKEFLLCLPSLLKVYPRLFFLNIGRIIDEEYYRSLLQVIAGNNLEGNVKFCGENSAELGDEYHACDIYIQASVAEGFCIPVLEALCCGKRVVATHTGAMPDLVKETGGGRIVEKVEPNVLLKAVSELLRKEDPGNIQKRYEYLKGKYSWNNIAEKTMALYSTEMELNHRKMFSNGIPG